MIPIIIYDIDGMVAKRDKRFSERYARDFGVPIEKLLPFFKNVFPKCLLGEADLRAELPKYFGEWDWEKSLDKLLEYWFKYEGILNKEIIKTVDDLRQKGVRCCIATNNEKYRSEYLWNDFGLQNHFDDFFSSSAIGTHKSDETFWESVWQSLGKPNKNDVVVWDDESKNIEAITKFGFKAERYTDFSDYHKKIEKFLA